MSNSEIGIKLRVDASGVRQEILGVDRALDNLKGTSASAATGSDRLAQALGRVAHYGTAGGGVLALAAVAGQMGRALFEASSQAERLQTKLQFSTGNAGRDLEYLRGLTQRLGLDFLSTADAFAGFAAASRGTTLEGAKTREVFESIAKASAVMGLSTDQAQGALLAVQQMMSKGVVSAEEFRGQLGERLPIALQAGARALGVTTAEFSKLLESGQIVAAEFLPKFAVAIDEALGDAPEQAAARLDASVNRMNNAWQRLLVAGGDSGPSGLIANEVNAITQTVEVLAETMERSAQQGAGSFEQLANAAGALVGRGAFSLLEASAESVNGALYLLTGGLVDFGRELDLVPDNLKTTAQQFDAVEGKLKTAQTEYARLTEQLRNAPDNIYVKSDLALLGRYIGELQRARQEKALLLGRDLPENYGNEGRRWTQDRAAQQAADDLAQRQKAAYDKLMGSMAGPQEKLAQAIADAKNQMGALYSPAIEAKLRSHYIKPTREAKAITDELTKAAERGVKLFGDLTAQGGGLSPDFAESWNDLSAAYQKGRLSLEELVAAQAALLAKQPAMVDAVRAEAQAYEALVRLESERVAGLERGAASMEDRLRQLQDENTAAEVAAAQNISLAQAIELVAIARLQEQQAALMREGDRDSEVLAIQREIDARRQLAVAIGTKDAREAAGQSAKDAAREWERTAENIERSLTDALMRGFESGEDAAQVLRDTVVNMFKTMVLRPVVQAIVQPLAGAVTGAVSGALGGGNAFGAASNAYSAYNAGSSMWYSNFSGAAGTQALRWGDYLATSQNNTLASAGEWLQGNYAEIGSAANALASAAAAIQGLNSLAEGNYGGAAGSAIGYYFGGPLGATIGNWIGSELSETLFGDAGTLHTGGVGSYSAAQGASYAQRSSGLLYDPGMQFGGDAYSEATAIGSATIAQAVSVALDGFATAFGQQAGYWVGTGYADDSSGDGAWGALTVMRGEETLLNWGRGNDRWPGREFANGQAGQEGYLAAVATDVREVLKGIAPDWADAMLDALGDDVDLDGLGTVTAAITRVQAALEGMGDVMPQLADLSGEAATGLLGLFGGIDNLAAATGAYYQAYYSEAERAAITTRQVGEAMNELGLKMPDSREAFRAMVEAQDLSTESGRSTYAELMRLSGAFASVTQAAADTGLALSDGLAERFAEMYRDQLGRLPDAEGLAYWVDQVASGLMTMEQAARAFAEGGGTERLRLRILELEDPMAHLAEMRRREASLMSETNAALQQQIWVLEDAAVVAQERAGLERQLLDLQGDTAAIRALERAALDESNRALYDRITALQDEQALEAERERAAAEREAARAQATQQAEAERQRIAQEREGLQRQLLSLQGNTVAIRAQERAALDASNRALYDQIVALQDAAAAASLAAQQEQALAAERERVAQERAGLERQLLQLQGDTLALRALERAELDASNRALYDQVIALEDANRVQAERETLQRQLLQVLGDEAAIRALERDALDESNRALYDQIQALQAAKEAWGGVTDSIEREVERIRGLIAGDSAMTLAQAQAQFAISTAQARAGDATAAAALPGLSKTVLDLSEASAASLLDLQRLRAQVANSLQGTASAVAPFAIAPLQSSAANGEVIVTPVPVLTNETSGVDTVLVTEVRALREENRAQALAIVNLQTRLARVLERWDVDGIPEERAAA